jgi:uncharacterized protein
MTRALITAAVLLFAAIAHGADAAPWGHAKPVDYPYLPEKVVFDVTTGDPAKINSVLDRVSALDKIYGADPFQESIVVLIHGSAIPFFAIQAFPEYRTLVTRAQSLTANGTIEFRLCQMAAKARYGLAPKDIHGFIKMVPNGDAELIRLQRREGYAYMH